MHTVVRNNLLPARFGQNIKDSEIQEMIDMVTAQKISHVFGEKNDIFPDRNHTLHIDVRIIANNSNLPGANLYKVDVQRKTGTITTIGEAFITLGAEAEYLANPFSSQVPALLISFSFKIINRIGNLLYRLYGKNRLLSNEPNIKYFKNLFDNIWVICYLICRDYKNVKRKQGDGFNGIKRI